MIELENKEKNRDESKFSTSSDVKKSKGLVPIFLPSGSVPVSNILLKTGIFTPLKRGHIGETSFSLKMYEKIKGKSCSVSVEYFGPRFDLSIDFKVFLTVVELLHKEETSHITISEKDFMFLLGYSSKELSSSKKDLIKKRVERLNSSSVVYKINDFMGLPKEFEFPLVSGFYMSETKSYRFNAVRDFKSMYSFFSWRSFSRSEFLNIKTERAKSLYSFYESRFFHKFSKTNLKIKKSTLSKLFLMEDRKNKEVNRVLKNTHEELKRNNQITSFSIDKNFVYVSINNKMKRI